MAVRHDVPAAATGRQVAFAPLVDGPHIDEARHHLAENPHEVLLPAGHPREALIAFALAMAGRAQEATATAARLRSRELSVPDVGDHGQTERAADIASVRIWLSWIEQRSDAVAVEVAAALVDPTADYALDAHRRATLHYALGVAHSLGSRPADAATLREAALHLSRARSLAALIGFERLEVGCLARLSLLHLPSGDYETARRLGHAAVALAHSRLVHGDDSRLQFWRLAALSAEQLARYFQGHEIEAAVVVDIEQTMRRFTFDAVVTSVAATTVALAHAQTGQIQRARGMLDAVLADHHVGGLGLWRVRTLHADGHLALISGDASRTAERIDDLASAGAPAESLLLRAMHLAAGGDTTGALAAVTPVTSGAVPSQGTIFSAACATEAVLLETSGRPDLADERMRLALGSAEPHVARRIFSVHDGDVMTRLARRAVEARPHDRWAADVLTHVREQRDRGLATPVWVGTPSERTSPRTLARTTSARPAPAASPGSPLTSRELEVLHLVDAGASQAQMATELYVSLNTIKTHLRSIRQKLGVERTAQAAAVARREGWLRQ